MADESAPTPQPRNLKERAFDEFKRFVAIFLYLWVVFGLLSIHKSLVLSQRHLDYEEHTFAIINAFVFAKVLLVGEELHLGRRFQDKPLIYPVLYKCLVFSVVLIFFHALESIAVGMWHGNTLAASIPPILGWNPKGLLAVGFSCFVLLIPFFGFREMARVLGRTQIRNLLFGKK
jgi:hypothetical protein